MKRLMGLFILTVASGVFFSGCVPGTYKKSVTVHKNPAGQITEIVETEEFVEAHQEMKRIEPLKNDVKFEYLK